MTIDLYYLPGSAPCTSVRALAQILGIDLNLKVINLSAGEHLTPEYLKINPQHTIPALVDNDFNIWESRAILIYLAEQYGDADDDSLYPKCPKQRAVVNQRLYFDLSSLYASFGEYFYPQVFANADADPEKLKKLDNALELLNTFLTGHTYVAGDNLTIADIAILTSIVTFVAAGIDVSKYANVSEWLATCKSTVSSYELIENSGEDFKAFIAKNKK